MPNGNVSQDGTDDFSQLHDDANFWNLAAVPVLSLPFRRPSVVSLLLPSSGTSSSPVGIYGTLTTVT
eukprot:917845-Amorphochlora_amoeboformis.AAC.1